MKAVCMLFMALFLQGCTAQWANITTKSVDNMGKYKEITPNKFIFDRYITPRDKAGIGLLYRGMEFVGKGLDKIATNKEVDILDVYHKYYLFSAHYNLADYSQLLKPKVELNNLCIVHGGELKLIEKFRRNIPGENFNKLISAEFFKAYQQVANAEEIAQSVNNMGVGIQITPDIEIPLYATASDIRWNAIKSTTTISQRNALRSSSIEQKLISGDMGVQGEEAFYRAMSAESFGIFACENNSTVLWRLSIVPLWNEVSQKTMTNKIVIHMSSDI